MISTGIDVITNGVRTVPDLRSLASPLDLDLLPPVEYAYDFLPSSIPSAPQVAFLDKLWEIRSYAVNALQLDPLGAGFPYRSSFSNVYVNRHWESNRNESSVLLRLLANDQSLADIEVRNGITVAKLAKKTLRPGKEHQIALATQFMYPGADRERLRLISALMVLYFVFDDKVEETPNQSLAFFRDDFIRRLAGHHSSTTSKLQKHIDEVVHSIHLKDAEDGGNGGKEMLQALREAFCCVRPEEGGFKSVQDYLRFRRYNVGAAFVIAAAKFSIGSNACVTDERFLPFLSLASDHLGLVNDLASYDKELRALENGDTRDMINIVDVVKSVTHLRGTDDVKKIVWALQLQFEGQMVQELEALQQTQNLSEKERDFLLAVTSTAVGNVMFCMTTSRYGGEAARIKGKAPHDELSFAA